MFVGHINLEKSCDGSAEHFVRLIEALQRFDTQQYVIVRNRALTKRLDLLDDVTVGPLARSSVTAACLMPHVDVVHIHNTSARQAGLILKLTRSIPFVLTGNDSVVHSGNPVVQAIYNRAAGLIAARDADVNTHIQLYRRAMDTLRVPMMLL